MMQRLSSDAQVIVDIETDWFKGKSNKAKVVALPYEVRFNYK